MGKTKKAEGGSLVTCPECAKVVTLKGFAGHMRFKHGVSVGNAKELTSAVKNEATNVEKDVRLYQLMDLLVECRDRKEKVDGMLADVPLFPLFGKDEPAEALKRGLDAQEKDICAELKSLGYDAPPEGS